MDRNKTDSLDSGWRVLQREACDEPLSNLWKPTDEPAMFPPVRDELQHEELPDKPGMADALYEIQKDILEKFNQIKMEIASLRMVIRELTTEVPREIGRRPDAGKSSRFFR